MIEQFSQIGGDEIYLIQTQMQQQLTQALGQEAWNQIATNVHQLPPKNMPYIIWSQIKDAPKPFEIKQTGGRIRII